jgi:drug/metabolite transporter (DMT)-like permease
MEIALKLVIDDFNPFQMTFLRFLIGSLILLPFAIKGLKDRNLRLTADDIGFFALTGFICVAVSMVLYQLALLFAPASTVAILLSSVPLFAVLFAVMFLHEKIYRYTVISMLINVIGIIVIINPQKMSGSVEGITLILLSSVAFAAYSVIGRQRTQYYGGISLTSFSFLFGSLELLVLMLITNIQPVADILLQTGMPSLANIPVIHGINLHTLPYLIFLGVFATGLGYMFYFFGMEETSTATGSLVFFIKPAVAPVFALLILNETITLSMIAGIILIITGSSISFIGDHRMSKMKSVDVIEG